MLICGGSAYPREWDYKRLYEIAQKVGALLMSDMAHIRCRAFLSSPAHIPSSQDSLAMGSAEACTLLFTRRLF